MLAGLIFVTAPAVAVASLLVSTDTPMLCCFALALLAQSHLIERRSALWALAMGTAIGAGLMSKYAMIYFPISAIVAAIALPGARIAWRDVAIAAVIACVIVAPNCGGTTPTASRPCTTPPTTPTSPRAASPASSRAFSPASSRSRGR